MSNSTTQNAINGKRFHCKTLAFSFEPQLPIGRRSWNWLVTAVPSFLLVLSSRSKDDVFVEPSVMSNSATNRRSPLGLFLGQPKTHLSGLRLQEGSF